MFGVAAAWVFLMMTAERQPVNPQGFLCCSVVAIFALLSIAKGIQELGKGRATTAPGDYHPEDFESDSEDESDRFPAETSALVPKEQAESIVRAIAKRHGAKGILRTLGNFRPEHLANAAARFAKEMTEDETPLAFLDTSVLKNGKSGFLLTNRAVYSSLIPFPIWLSDIDEVIYVMPGFGDYFEFWLLGAFYFLFRGIHSMQRRLRVNGQTVYATGNRVRAQFWVELLLTLAEAAREAKAAPPSIRVNAPPRSVVLEIAVYRGGEQPDEIRRYRNAAWEQIEQGIRELDGDMLPSLRIWRGQPNEGTALDVLGGNGKYVLREVGDGWVYYDPNQEDEEVEVFRSGQGYRCPAFYVCTDLDRVLNIVRLFIDRGEFE